MVASWCFLLDIGPQSLGPRREVDIALRSLCQALENLELNFCNTWQVFWCIVFLHFFWIHWRSQKKLNLKSNVMNSLKSHIPNLCVEGLADVGGLAQDRTLECHSQRYRDTSGDAALSSIFFRFQKFPTKSTSTALLFNRVSRRFWWRHATTPHIKNTPKNHQNEKRKTKTTSFPSCPTYSHTRPHGYHPSPLPLVGKRRQRHGSASGTVQLWSRTWRRSISQLSLWQVALCFLLVNLTFVVVFFYISFLKHMLFRFVFSLASLIFCDFGMV